MHRAHRGWIVGWVGAAALACTVAPAAADTTMQRCGQQYQAAKAANTLNGMTWTQFRTDCASRMKASAPDAPAAPAATPAVAANPLNPAPATPAPATPAATTAATPAPAPAEAPAAAGGRPMSAGRTAFVARERQCGTEWKANKASLVAATPGLTWPKYLSQCNTRLKAAGK